MNCDDVENFVHPYVDGEFEQKDRLEVESHLAGCPSCSRRVQFERAFRTVVREKGHGTAGEPIVRAPESLRASVQTSLRREARRRALNKAMALSAAAAVAVAIGGAA